jgi:integrase
MAKHRQTRAPRGSGTAYYSRARRIWVAKKTVNGVRIERTGRTQAEAIRKRDAVLPPTSDVTLAEWFERWLRGLKVRDTTRAAYRHSFQKNILPAVGTLPALGPMRLTAITSWHVDELVNEWSKGKDGMGPGGVRALLARLSSCLSAAVRAELINRNPVSRVRRPKKPPPKFDLFSPDELRAIIDLASTRLPWYPLAVCAAIGCRIGESLALEPTDYDTETGELSIERTWTRKGIGPPKSEAGIRTVRVPALIQGLFAVAKWENVSYTTMLSRWGPFLKRLGLRYRALHQLRHSVASYLINGDAKRDIKGMSLPNVAKELGDVVETIVSTYLHVTPGADIAETMGAILGGAPEAAKRRA